MSDIAAQMTPRELDELASLLASKLKQGLRDELPAGRLLDRDGIAAYLGVSANHILKLGLPSLRLGQRRLYDPDACIAQLEQAERKQTWADLRESMAGLLSLVAANPGVVDEYYGPTAEQEAA